MLLFYYRFICIKWPLKYWQNQEAITQYSKRVIVCIWMFGVLIGIVPVLGIIPGDNYKVHHAVGMTLSTKMDEWFLYESIMVLSLLSIWTLNIASYLNYSEGTQDVLSSNVKQRFLQKKMQRSLMTSVRLVVIAITVCYLPLIMTQAFSHFPALHPHKYPDKFDTRVNFSWNISMFLSSRLVFINAFMNCIIYNFSNKTFLMALRRHVLRNTRYSMVSSGRSSSSLARSKSLRRNVSTVTP